MPTYLIHGKTITTDRPLTDSEATKIFRQLQIDGGKLTATTQELINNAGSAIADTKTQVVVPAQPDIPPTGQDSDIAMWGAIAFTLIVIVGPFLGAIALNRKHLRLRPNCQPFAWGYYTALVNFLTPFLVAGTMRQQGLDLTSVRVLLAVLVLTYFPLAILTLRRNRIGFVLLSVLQLNPINWLINGIYIKNRWQELSPSVISQPVFAGTGSSPPSHPTQHVSATNAHFAQAFSEMETGSQDKGLWARCYADANGEEGKAKAAYLRHRAIALATQPLNALPSGTSSVDFRSESPLGSSVEPTHSDETIRRQFLSARNGTKSAEQFSKISAILSIHKSPIDARRLLQLCGYETMKFDDEFGSPTRYAVSQLGSSTKVAEFSSAAEFVEWVISISGTDPTASDFR